MPSVQDPRDPSSGGEARVRQGLLPRDRCRPPSLSSLWPRSPHSASGPRPLGREPGSPPRSWRSALPCRPASAGGRGRGSRAARRRSGLEGPARARRAARATLPARRAGSGFRRAGGVVVAWRRPRPASASGEEGLPLSRPCAAWGRGACRRLAVLPPWSLGMGRSGWSGRRSRSVRNGRTWLRGRRRAGRPRRPSRAPGLPRRPSRCPRGTRRLWTRHALPPASEEFSCAPRPVTRFSPKMPDGRGSRLIFRARFRDRPEISGRAGGCRWRRRGCFRHKPARRPERAPRGRRPQLRLPFGRLQQSSQNILGEPEDHLHMSRKGIEGEFPREKYERRATYTAGRATGLGRS